MEEVWVGGRSEQAPTHLPHQRKPLDPPPTHTHTELSKAEPLRPSLPMWTPQLVDVGEAVSSVRDVWVPNIKGDREFAVPIRASLSKPGAGRIKAQGHLPANPRQECFLPSIVSFSSPQARRTAPTPTLCTGSRTLTLAGLDAPTSPRLSINPTSKGPTGCLLSCSDAGAPRQRKELVSHYGGLGLNSTSAFTF